MNTINPNIRGLCGALAVALGLGLAHPAGAEDQPERQWARQPGTAGNDDATAVATDTQGNVYVAGHTFGSLAAINHGLNDAWIVKYSAAGALLWKRQFGTAEEDLAFGVATDQQGNVYIAGQTNGSLGGSNKGPSDAWIKKVSAAGVLLWKRQPGTQAFDGARGVATDVNGNVYLAGSTNGSLAGPSHGNFDAWIKKYSAAGALLWKQQFGTPSFDSASGVATDHKGGVYIVGSTEGSLVEPNQNDHDAFIVKYESD